MASSMAVLLDPKPQYDDMDPCQYIRHRLIPLRGQEATATVLRGLVLKKNLPHRRMPKKIEGSLEDGTAPKILVPPPARLRGLP